MRKETTPKKKDRDFTHQLLDDLQRLETLLENGEIESGVRRIGAEQELFLVDSHFRPKPCADKLLPRLGDDRFTSELALFNLEINLDPQIVQAGCLARMEKQLSDLLMRLQEKAAGLQARPLLTGILPTLHPAHLTQDNQTPKERYTALAEAVRDLRGEEYDLRIEGADELWIRQSSVMPEACNTSFQFHIQVDADEFVPFYNAAQLASGPVLAAAAGSPLLFGRRLWHETRIALFQQAIDERRTPTDLRKKTPRVDFGRAWVRESVLDIFREDVSRYRVLLPETIDEPESNDPPSLDALRLFNSTVYRWNRPCYGILGGQPHLRIENRMLPAGPSVIDQMANGAFWIGLVQGLVEVYGDVGQRMPFRDARESFLAAARNGLTAQLSWPGHSEMPARQLILEHALPIAQRGLKSLGLQRTEIDRYLEPVRSRVIKHRSPATWMLESFNAGSKKTKPSQRLAGICRTIAKRQMGPESVAYWSRAQPVTEADHDDWRVRRVMSKDFLTVHPDQSIRFALELMDWHRLESLPVEDERQRLKGLLTKDDLASFLLAAGGNGEATSKRVQDVMNTNVLTVAPDVPTGKAVKWMPNEDQAMPVTDGGRLVGLLRPRDLEILSARGAKPEAAEMPS